MHDYQIKISQTPAFCIKFAPSPKMGQTEMTPETWASKENKLLLMLLQVISINLKPLKISYPVA